MKKTLLIMAAGMASRYGGSKQIDGLGPNGEMLMEYSIAHARRAGFGKVVFVISPAMELDFPQLIARRVSDIELACAVQSHRTLPGGFHPPIERIKPYGTVHAVLSAAEHIDSPFAVINADDFYGEQAFADASRMLEQISDGQAAMIAYPLGKTLSMSGDVTRGICSVDPNGRLVSVHETYRISSCIDGTIRSFDESNEGTALPPDMPASMNFWGFTPSFLECCRAELALFLDELTEHELRAEYPLPVMIDKLVSGGKLEVLVCTTDSEWMGVTYREDRAIVSARLAEMYS